MDGGDWAALLSQAASSLSLRKNSALKSIKAFPPCPRSSVNPGVRRTREAPGTDLSANPAMLPTATRGEAVRRCATGPRRALSP